MENSLPQALGAAVLRVLRPLARVLLRHGMSYGSFAELARRAFIEEGYACVQESGKRVSVSSVAALTGLTRKETKRLREQPLEMAGQSAQRYSRAIRVISGWISDPEFQDSRGEPANLPIEGASGSFNALVRKYSGDITPAAMLVLLESSANLVRSVDTVQLIERAYIPLATPVDKISILGTDVAELIGAIGHNLEAPPEQRFFQRKVSNVAVRADAVAEFRALSNRRSQELLEEYHAWLSAHEVDSQADNAVQPVYVAVGIYFVERPRSGGPQRENP